jgi:hypothetical protein
MIHLFLLACAVRVAADETRPLAWSTRVTRADGLSIGTVDVRVGEEPADVAYAFSVRHGLDPATRDAIVAKACAAVACARRRALLYRKQIGANVGTSVGALGTVEIWADEEPADAVLAFCTAHNLGEYTRRKIIAEACATIACNRIEPIMFRTVVGDMNGTAVGELTIREGTEPADVFYRFCRSHTALIDGSYCRALMGVVLAQACEVMPCGRRRALAYRAPIVLDNIDLGVLTVWHDEEPADAIYAFCAAQNVSAPGACAPIIAQVCTSAYCERNRPLFARQSVAGPGGDTIGVVDVLEGDEAADQVLRFFRLHALPAAWDQRQITDVLCATLAKREGEDVAKWEAMGEEATPRGCARRRGIAASIAVSDGVGEALPEPLVVYGDMEGADDVWLFCKRYAERLVAGTAPLLAALAQLEAPGLGVAPALSGDGAELQPVLRPAGSAALIGPKPRAHREMLLKSNALRRCFHTLFAAICQKELVLCTRATPRVGPARFPVAGISHPLELYAWSHVVDTLVSWLSHKEVAPKHVMLAYDGYRKQAGGASGVAEKFARRAARRTRRWTRHQRLEKLATDRAKEAAVRESAKEAETEAEAAARAVAEATADAKAEETEYNATRKAVEERRADRNRTAWGDVQRSDVYIELLRRFCNATGRAEYPELYCERVAASEVVETVTVTQWGVPHHAELRRPPVAEVRQPPRFAALTYDPTPLCNAPEPHYKTHHHHAEFPSPAYVGDAVALASREDMMHLCSARAAVDLCTRMRPAPPGCHQSLFEATRTSYDVAATHRWSGKKPDEYVTLGLTRDALYADIDIAYRYERWSLGADLSPYAPRGSNASATPLWHRWDERTAKMHLIESAQKTLINVPGRKFHDQPCKPVFGGAFCARMTADGGMSIVMG